MSHVISDIGNTVSNVASDVTGGFDINKAIAGMGHSLVGGGGGILGRVGSALANPSNLIGASLGFGIGGAGGLTGGNIAGNVARGQPIGTNLGGAAIGDVAGLGIGIGASGLMGGAAGGGADALGGYTVDPMTGDVIPASWSGGAAADPMAGYTVDPNTGDVIPNAGGTGVGSGGTVSSGGPNYGGAAANAASRVLGGGGGNPLTNFLTGQGGGPSLPSLAPGIAALTYASQQKPVDTTQLQNVFGAAGANAPLFVQAAQSPLQQAQAGGYGDILQSQASRGIRGSSFGDQDIANYMNTTNQGISNAGINAAQAALGLQGNLAGQISNLNALSQQMKNDLYGRAFSSIGQGLNPTPGMGGSPWGVNPQGGAGGSGGIPGAGFLNNLNLGGVANAFGNGLTSIGSGLGNIFGSPGSTFWGTGPVSQVQSLPAAIPGSFFDDAMGVL